MQKSSGDGQDLSAVVFPPLMSTLDTYMDASSDLRYSNVVDKVKANKKKTGKKVAKKKASNNNVPHMEPIDPNLLRPESRVPSQESPRSQYRLRHYSAGEREDMNFDSMSLESAQKDGDHLARKMLVSSPPLADRKAGKSSYTPHSPARILVQPAPGAGAGYNYSKAYQNSPPEGYSSMSHQSPGSHMIKSDLGFGKAVESIAAIKLHNYAMKRRDHVSHKLKLMKEIRSFKRENNAELIEARKLRKDEMLAAWKLRYYIEYLRLNSVRHIVEIVEGRNQELEEECSLLQQSSAVAEIENESLTKEISRLGDSNASLQERNAVLDAMVRELQRDLQDKSESLIRLAEGSEGASQQARELIQLNKQALQQETEQSSLLRNELQLTRLTCQELVRTSAAKDSTVADMSAELIQLRALHKSEQEQILAARDTHMQEIENARMREEDNEIRLRKAANLHTVLNDREKTIRHYEAEVIAMGKEIVALKATIEQTSKLVAQEKEVIAGIDQEKSGLQKLLAELAKRLTQADEEAIKHKVVEKQHKADAKTAQGVINGHLATIRDLEDQGAAATAEIEFLVEENHELAREIECHHMYGEEMMQRYLTTFSAAERHLEYSRFLEEELFCARKLYEKTSTQYSAQYPTDPKVPVGAGMSVSDMFGDVSEESYAYKNSFKNAGNEGGEADGTLERRDSVKSKSAIEAWTGLEPVPPMILHLNSFSKGAPRRGRPGDYERPNSASLYNPDSRPHSTGAPNNSMVAEQRFMMILSQLEEKMKSVDRAADSLRFLAEKADAIEKVQNSTASILNSHATAEAMARQPVRLSVQMQAMSQANVRAMEDKTSMIDRHIGMERVFSEMHASLDQVNADLAAQEQEVTRLQSRRAECKETISAMKKRIKKSRKASMKETNAPLLTEAEENATESEMSSLNDEMETLKDRINACKADNLNLNSKSIALQTELYHLDQDLEKSASEFLDRFGEHITAYYPAELAHLIENNDGQLEEHGHYNPPPAGANLHLNTLYEEDEWSESIANVEGHSTEGSSLVNTPGPPTAEGMEGIANNVEFVGGDSSSMEEMSEIDGPYESPYTPSGKTPRKDRKKSKMNDESFERSRKSSKMGKLSRKLSKSAGKSSKKHRPKSTSFDADSVDGSTYEFGTAQDLEEGSSGLVDDFGGADRDESHMIPAPGDIPMDVGFSPEIATANRKHIASDNTLTGQAGVYAKSTESINSFTLPGTGSKAGSTVLSGSLNSPTASRVLGSDYSTDRQARQQSQQARERLSHLRGDLERVIADLDPALDAVEQLESARYSLRAEIVRWIENFVALCGYVPERSDRMRSVTLQPWVAQFAAVQSDLQMAHSRAVAITSSAFALRTALALEQHQHVSGLSAEQLDEQLRLLYPIVDLGELVLEDPFSISNNDVPGSFNGIDSVSELSSMYQSMELAPLEGVNEAIFQESVNSQSVASSAAFAPMQAPAAARAPAPAAAPAVARPVIVTSAAPPTSFAAPKAALAAPQPDSPKKYVVKADSFSGLMEMVTAEDAGDDGDSVVTTDSPANAGRKKKNKKDRKKEKEKSVKNRSLELNETATSTPERELERAPAPGAPAAAAQAKESGDLHASASARVAAASSTAPVRVPYRETITDGTYSFPTTPFTDKIAGLNYDGQSVTSGADASFKLSKSMKWEGMFAPSGEESIEAMTAENKKLRKELRIWTSDFVKFYGRKPIPSDFDSFDDIIKAKLFRKNQLSVLLGETNEKSTVDGESDVEPFVPGGGGGGSHSRPGSKSKKAVVNRAGNHSAGSEGNFSVPTTPYGDRFGGMQGKSGLSTTDFSMRFSKSTKWAGMFAEDGEVGEQTVEALQAEQEQLKLDLRDWAASYYNTHGHKPSPDDYESFDGEIKKKLFRKDQIKAILTQLQQAQDGVEAQKQSPAAVKSGSRGSSPSRKAGPTSASKADGGYSLPGTPYGGAPIARLDSSMELAAQLEGGELSLEDLLQEQATLRNDIRLWTQDYIAQTGRKPNVEDFTGLDLDIKAKLVRKNQIKKLLAQHGVTTAASRKYGGGTLDVDSLSLASDATPKSAPADKARPRVSEEASSAHVPVAVSQVQPASPKAAAVVSQPQPVSPKSQPESPKAASPERSAVSAAAPVPTPALAPAAPVEDEFGFVEEVPEAPAVVSDEGSSPKRSGSPGKSDRRASSSHKKHRKSKSGRPSSRGGRDSGSESDSPERVGSAQSDDRYTMPTTPYASNFGGLDSTDNSVDDVSIKMPSATWEGLNMASAARSIAESIDESPEVLNQELNQLKRELRKWNAAFMKKHGRMPGAEDFALFDEDIKVKLFRKNQIKKLLDEAEKGPGEMGQAFAGAAALAAVQADTTVREVERYSPEDSAESKHRRTGSQRSKPQPAADEEEEEREVSAEVVAKASVPRITSSESREGSSLADMDSTDPAVAEISKELASIKQSLKLWQHQFVETTGRESGQQDLTAEVLAMGERRDELKRLLVQHKRSDLVSAKTSLFTPTLSPNHEVATPISTPTPSRPKGSADRAERLTSPKSKRVSFVNREAAQTFAEETEPADLQSAVAAVVTAVQPISAAAVSPARESSVRKASHVTAAAVAPAVAPVVQEYQDQARYEESQSRQASAQDSRLQTPAEKVVYTVEQLEELNREYSKIKKALKKWQRDFVDLHGRDPGDEDFDKVDDGFKEMIVRKYELKEILGDESAQAQLQQAQQSIKAKKSKKSSKSKDV